MTDSVTLPCATFLTSHKLPSTGMTYLSDQEVREWLEGWLGLWKPEKLALFEGIPQLGGPFDHDPPRPGHFYSVPHSTLAILPNDWPEKVTECGSQSEVLKNPELENVGNPPWFCPEEGMVFQSLGFGYAWLEAFCDSQDHPHLLDIASFTDKVRTALDFWKKGDFNALKAAASEAASLLVQARESITSSSLFHVDLTLAETLPPEALESTDWLHCPIQRTVIASGQWLENWEKKDPKNFQIFRKEIEKGLIEMAGGLYIERDEPLRSIESQLWNMRQGKSVYDSLLGQTLKVFARTKSGLHSLTPLLIQKEGFRRAVLLSFDDGTVPHYRAPVISWSGSDGKSVEALARVPLPAESPQTWFHMAYHLGRAVREDHAPTVVLIHKEKPSVIYKIVTQLAALAPVMGRWVGLDTYLNEATPAEYPGVAPWDDFNHDWLTPYDATESQNKDEEQAPGLIQGNPVSERAIQVRKRRRMDAAFTLSAIHEVLDKGVTKADWQARRDHLKKAEFSVEMDSMSKADEESLELSAKSLADRLLGKSPHNPGFIVFNPCGFTRRVALELQGIEGFLEPEGPIKAFQKDGDLSRIVLEVPSLGYTWISSKGGLPKPPPRARLRLADEKTVRNEFFEAEIDPDTGAIRAFRDVRLRQNRIVHQLAYLPGSRMKLIEAKVGSSGPALGELTCTGEITDEQGQTLAKYTQRLRAWIGRPVLEISVTIEPVRMPSGYPWHSAFAARFSLPSGASAISRGTLGMVDETKHNRPLTPEFIEWKSGNSNVALLTGGMPFLQRHGSSQLDLILIPPGETATQFEYGLCMDRG